MTILVEITVLGNNSVALQSFICLAVFYPRISFYMRYEIFIRNAFLPLIMGFSRRFPRDVKGSPYPSWEEVYLSKDEERALEKEQRKENIVLMRECINDAKKLFFEEKLKEFQSDVINVSIALFEKRASHSVYWKEESAKEKFDKAYGKKQ